MYKSIDELISSGINPRYSAQKICIDHYHAIVAARRLRRTWAEIAESLGLDPSSSCRSPSGALAAAWARTKKSLATGKLVIPPSASASRSAGWAANGIGDPKPFDATNPLRNLIGGGS